MAPQVKEGALTAEIAAVRPGTVVGFHFDRDAFLAGERPDALATWS